MHSRSRHYRVVPLLLAVCTACDATQRPASTRPTGTVVESSVPRWSVGNAWQLDTAPEVKIGERDGAPEYALSNVVGGVRLSDGRIVVANRGTHDLRYYDARGKHLRTAGGEGEGPGEFRFIDAIGIERDTVMVWDAFARRVSRFHGNGSFGGSTTLEGLDLPFPVLLGTWDDGSLLLRRRGDADLDVDREGEYVDSVTYLRFSTATGAQIAVLGPYLSGEMFRAVASRHYQVGHVIFGKRSFVATADGGFYQAETDRFAATLHTPDGTPVRTVRRPHAPLRATVADVAAQREKLEQGDDEITRMSPRMAAAQRRLIETLPHRPTLPAITGIHGDRRDNLWLRAYVPPDASAAEWSVFDPRGHWLGIVNVPADFHVLGLGDGWMRARTTDPLAGVERVVLHRLRKPR